MKIVIIGGGTAGWWAAGYLEKMMPESEITLIESDTIPKIGVGESTLPQIKTFFDSMGIDESEWMDSCSAVRKYGNIKQGWNDPNDDEFTFTFWWNENNIFDTWVKDYHLGNKTKDQLNNDLYKIDGWNPYAYHLDAEYAGVIVKNRCKNVKHIIQTINDDSTLPMADLYIDCTGFSRKFISDRSFVKMETHLVDSVVVCPFELKDIPSNYTRSIARKYGWQFLIELQNRIGTGYVYSSQHVSDEDALIEFNQCTEDMIPYLGKVPRIIKWTPGILTESWSGNIVAIGISSGFIDPLESNSLFMTQLQITTLVKCLKRGLSSKEYNRLINQVWRDVSTYITHHYSLSNRNDTEFWNYYKQFDVKESLWKNYKSKGNKYTNVFPDAIWATMGIYFNEFTHYTPK